MALDVIASGEQVKSWKGQPLWRR